jgi:hypothetical protein
MTPLGSIQTRSYREALGWTRKITNKYDMMMGLDDNEEVDLRVQL